MRNTTVITVAAAALASVAVGAPAPLGGPTPIPPRPTCDGCYTVIAATPSTTGPTATTERPVEPAVLPSSDLHEYPYMFKGPGFRWPYRTAAAPEPTATAEGASATAEPVGETAKGAGCEGLECVWGKLASSWKAGERTCPFVKMFARQ
ncbi:hypothetical protein JDV02_005686 [Purpureocillium takamizusanense]|uniref:Uncharacterized protein n=1 Tax=Purpureocillium takamizusanense TaxID=2060973 RepID=A0A9Q8VC39_9HYPO|nr:uncharacterized protein JDV02_005686 [Purpureocillium takamizusanense]UNI19504.1 hypothetical protein JDV02_005686 [Purpureocillium takamizusanense]